MTGEPRCITPTDMAPPGGHYSHAVIGGGLVFVAGQLPITPSRNSPRPKTSRLSFSTPLAQKSMLGHRKIAGSRPPAFSKFNVTASNAPG